MSGIRYIVEDFEADQTLQAQKESLIRKRKVQTITSDKLARVEKRVWFESHHDHCASKLSRNSNEQSHYRKAVENHSEKDDTQNKLWDGNLNHRTVCNKLLILIERLDYEQRTAVMETCFGGFLSVRTSTIPKDLATWLLPNFNPASNILMLSDNRVLEITKEDVHATLALPMDQPKVQITSTCEPKNEYTNLLEQWRIMWNFGRIGSPKVGKMVDQILQRGDHGDEFLSLIHI